MTEKRAKKMASPDTGVPRSLKDDSFQDPTVGACLGPRMGAFYYERGTLGWGRFIVSEVPPIELPIHIEEEGLSPVSF